VSEKGMNCGGNPRGSFNRDLKLLRFQYRIRSKNMMTVRHIVGASVPRKEGWDKVHRSGALRR